MDYNNEHIFEELQSDFYRYMVIFGGIMPKTSRDYVTRLKFLSAKYRLGKNITEEYIDYILSEEEKAMVGRKKYSSKHSLSDFKSGLRKFLAFVKSDFRKRYEDSILQEMTRYAAIAILRLPRKHQSYSLVWGKGCSAAP